MAEVHLQRAAAPLASGDMLTFCPEAQTFDGVMDTLLQVKHHPFSLGCYPTTSFQGSDTRSLGLSGGGHSRPESPDIHKQPQYSWSFSFNFSLHSKESGTWAPTPPAPVRTARKLTLPLLDPPFCHPL